MSLSRYTPGKPKAVKPKPPHGSSQKTLTIKVKAHTRKITPRAPKAAPFDPNAQPITPGSAITAGQAARMAGNAVTVRYGPQQGQLQQNIQRNTQLGTDQAGWYDQYLKQLEAYRQDAQNRATQTNTAVQGQADSIRAIDQNAINANGQQMAADAAARGATVGPQVAQNATNASLVRQGLEGSFGALLASRGASAEQYASNLAHVVGPGQKLQAQAGNARTGQELLKQLADLKGQSGAYKQQFIDSLTQQEAKNVLAASIASGRDLTTQQTISEKVRHDKAQEGNTAKGLTVKAKSQAGKVNQYGYTDGQWRSMSVAQRQKVIRDFKPGKTPKTVKPRSGPGSLTAGAESHVVQAVKGARAAAQSLMSKPNAKSGEVRQLLAAGKVDGVKYTQDEINAAFDLLPPQYGGHGGLSPANVKALHRMGVHVNGVFPVAGHTQRVQGLSQQQTDTYKGIFGLK